jgi:hypothetical protein
MAKTKLIGTIGRLLFKAAYPFGSKKVDDLFKDGTFGDKAAVGALAAVDDTVDALSDNEADNKKQLNAVWVGYLRDTLLPAVGDEIKPILSKVASEALEALLVSLATKIVNSTYLFLDDIKDNPEQLKAYASEYLQGAEFRALVIGYLTEVINEKVADEGLRGFFLVAIEGLFDLIQDIAIDVNAARSFSAK